MKGLDKADLEVLIKERIFNNTGMSDNDKIEKIAYHFDKIMQTLGLDMTDDSLKDTPKRVAKMYVQETFSGLNPANKPAISLFDNNYSYHASDVQVSTLGSWF